VTRAVWPHAVVSGTWPHQSVAVATGNGRTDARSLATMARVDHTAWAMVCVCVRPRARRCCAVYSRSKPNECSHLFLHASAISWSACRLSRLEVASRSFAPIRLSSAAIAYTCQSACVARSHTHQSHLQRVKSSDGFMHTHDQLPQAPTATPTASPTTSPTTRVYACPRPLTAS
jgi:hypothetical protein